MMKTSMQCYPPVHIVPKTYDFTGVGRPVFVTKREQFDLGFEAVQIGDERLLLAGA